MFSSLVGCADGVSLPSDGGTLPGDGGPTTPTSFSLSGTWSSYVASASLQAAAVSSDSLSSRSVASSPLLEVLGEVTSFVTGSSTPDEPVDSFIIGYVQDSSEVSSNAKRATARDQRPGESLGWKFLDQRASSVVQNLPFDKVQIPANLLEQYKEGSSYNLKSIKDDLNASLSSDAIAYVEPDYRRKAFAAPNDTYYTSQWNMQTGFIDLPQMRSITTGSSSVIVAVIDTGVDQSLDDLALTHFVSGYDFVNNDNDPTDDGGHGTHVTGTIAQSTNNGKGVSGIAPGVSIMPIKVLASDGSGSVSALVAGIRYAVDNGASIINLSLGGSEVSQAEIDACAYAQQHGVLIVASAGNEGVTTKNYPAAIDSVLSVGAVGYSNLSNRSSYSNYGDWVDVMAYGGSLNANNSMPSITLPNGIVTTDGIIQQTIVNGQAGYYFYVGTSMASPHVAGLAALLKSVNPSFSATELYNRICDTAETSRSDYGLGKYGVIQPMKAIAGDVVPDPVPDPDPVPEPDPEPAVYQVSDSVSSSFADTSVLAAAWNFSAAPGSISLSLHTPAEDTGTYSLALQNANGQVVTSGKTNAPNVLDLSYTVASGYQGVYTLVVRYTP
ncbi:S8 family peptidase [Sphaerochaeta pleomorpha]|nr:S8 family peptidase [Sphaerochaeta pleomorpha]